MMMLMTMQKTTFILICSFKLNSIMFIKLNNIFCGILNIIIIKNVFFVVSFCRHSSYFFFWAFSAAFVTLPEVASLKLTDLITPTATVCLISRTAKRPNGGNSWKLSTHNGFDGTKLMIAASPDLIDLGYASVVLPVRRSHFSLISANLQAI